MAGLTDRDLRRIKRFVETPPRQRTPHLLTPDDDEEREVPTAANANGDTAGEDAEADPDVEVAG